MRDDHLDAIKGYIMYYRIKKKYNYENKGVFSTFPLP